MSLFNRRRNHEDDAILPLYILKELERADTALLHAQNRQSSVDAITNITTNIGERNHFVESFKNIFNQ